MGLSGAEIMGLCDDIKSGEAKLLDDEIAGVMDYLDSALSEKKSYLKKMHVPIVMYVAREAKEKGIDCEGFGAKLDIVFKQLAENNEFTDACLSGSSKRSNVQFRLKTVSDMMDKDGYGGGVQQVTQAKVKGKG
jgi:hypothetical protein